MLKLQEVTPKDFSKRSAHVSVTKGKYVIVWGGFSTMDRDSYSDDYLDSKTLAVYDTEICHWTSHSVCLGEQLPQCTSAAQGVLLDNYFYIFGGHNFKEGHTNRLYRVHLSAKPLQWERVYPASKVPSPRDKFAMCTFLKRIYCFGGFGPNFNAKSRWLNDNGSFQPLYAQLPMREFSGWNNQLLVYDPSSCEWSNPKCEGNVPLPRAAHAVAVIDSKMYLFGGRHNTKRRNDLYDLDFNTLIWTKLCPEANGAVPPGRSWHSLSAISSKRILLYGGFTQDEVPLGDVWILNTNIPQWTQIELPSKYPRLWHTASVVQDSVLIYGGCCNNILQDQSYIMDDHCGDMIEVRITPQSLYCLCLDVVFDHREHSRSQWVNLTPDIMRILEFKEVNSSAERFTGDVVNFATHSSDHRSRGCRLT